MSHETLFEKFIRITVAHVRTRALLKEFVRVQESPDIGAEAAQERESALLRLCQLAQEELSAPPVFIKMPRRPWWMMGFAMRPTHRQRP